eukprot:5459712-Prymnesium_polylepis.1
MALQGKARVVIQLASVVSTLSSFLDRPDTDDFDEDFELQFGAVAQKASRHRRHPDTEGLSTASRSRSLAVGVVGP